MSSDLPERQSMKVTSSLFGLAPGGVYTAAFVTKYAVSSYLAFSTLPNGGMFSVTLSLAPQDAARRYLAPSFKESGLSSSDLKSAAAIQLHKSRDRIIQNLNPRKPLKIQIF